MCRHHVEPRVKLYSPREKNLFFLTADEGEVSQQSKASKTTQKPARSLSQTSEPAILLHIL